MQIPKVEAADKLALAVIASSHAPLLLLDGDLTVVAASASFCRAFDIAPAAVSGRPLVALGSGEWNVPQLESLLLTIASGLAEIDAYEMDLARPGQENRRLVLNARKLHFDDSDDLRLLLTVNDVTDARRAEKIWKDMLSEKDILIREIQHRVANSLQIIASVLMQSARRVQSDETRLHLRDAHQRVMSIAALQRLLAGSTPGSVELRSYFNELCRSIGASMISDHNRLSLKAKVDERIASADEAVSLGLIVTELVINALKHGFPGQATGSIVVDYQSRGSAWALSVDDDGVGMQANSGSHSAGLGTSIVEALARKLGATVQVTDAHPGTRVSIIHA